MATMRIYYEHEELIGTFNQDDDLPEHITQHKYIEIDEQDWANTISVAGKLIVRDGQLQRKVLTDTEKEVAEIKTKVRQSIALLNDTDWYVTRFTETGKVIPVDIMTQRKEARTYIGVYGHLLENN